MSAKRFLAMFALLITISLLIYAYKRIETHSSSGLSINKSASYLANPIYNERLKFFKTFPAQKNIVMLGTSHTFYGGDWGLILNRCDAMNQGIQSDVTEGFKNRLNYVLECRPKVCFIEGGVNDMRNTTATTFDKPIGNLRSIVRRLRQNKIIAVLTTIPYGSATLEKFKVYNCKVYVMNQLIKRLAFDENIRIIDLNKMLAGGQMTIKPEYASYDGGHFAASAYKLWSDEIKKILADYNM